MGGLEGLRVIRGGEERFLRGAPLQYGDAVHPFVAGESLAVYVGLTAPNGMACFVSSTEDRRRETYRRRMPVEKLSVTSNGRLSGDGVILDSFSETRDPSLHEYVLGKIGTFGGAPWPIVSR